MGKDPAFLFYPGDWLGGTILFSRPQKGAFMDLLIAQFNTGHLSIEDIKDLLGSDYSPMWETRLRAKFVTDAEGNYFNERLESEIVKRKAHSKKQQENINKRWHPNTEPLLNGYGGITSVIPLENENENRDDNETSEEGVQGEGLVVRDPSTVDAIVVDQFDQFWNEYDKKMGNKEKLRSKFNKLPETDKQKIFEYIPLYKNSNPDKRFRKNPEAFLNQRGWEDEILPPTGSSLAHRNGYSDKQITNAVNLKQLING